MTTATTAHTRIPLPFVGEVIEIFGVPFTVTVVEPHSDYAWSVEAVEADGSTAYFVLPTKYRTF